MINKLKSSGAKVYLSLDLPEEVKKDAKDKKKEETSKTKTPGELEKETLDKRRAEAIANYTAQAANFQKKEESLLFFVLTAKSWIFQGTFDERPA